MVVFFHEILVMLEKWKCRRLQHYFSSAAYCKPNVYVVWFLNWFILFLRLFFYAHQKQKIYLIFVKVKNIVQIKRSILQKLQILQKIERVAILCWFLGAFQKTFQIFGEMFNLIKTSLNLNLWPFHYLIPCFHYAWSFFSQLRKKPL